MRGTSIGRLPFSAVCELAERCLEAWQTGPVGEFDNFTEEWLESEALGIHKGYPPRAPFLTVEIRAAIAFVGAATGQLQRNTGGSVSVNGAYRANDVGDAWLDRKDRVWYTKQPQLLPRDPETCGKIPPEFWPPVAAAWHVSQVHEERKRELDDRRYEARYGQPELV